MQGKDEDRLLEPGKKLMKIDDEARTKYQTPFDGYDTLQQATKDFVAEAWFKSSGRISTYFKILQPLSFLMEWMHERAPQLDSDTLQSKAIKHMWSLSTLKSIMGNWMLGKNQETLVAKGKCSIDD